MGASTFVVRSKGKSAREAFNEAVKDARWESGNGGYTGTIAEKHDYVMIVCPAGIEPNAYANQLIDEDDGRIEDKWGPAGCIKMSEGEYLFFGWASS